SKNSSSRPPRRGEPGLAGLRDGGEPGRWTGYDAEGAQLGRGQQTGDGARDRLSALLLVVAEGRRGVDLETVDVAIGGDLGSDAGEREGQGAGEAGAALGETVGDPDRLELGRRARLAEGVAVVDGLGLGGGGDHLLADDVDPHVGPRDELLELHRTEADAV